MTSRVGDNRTTVPVTAVGRLQRVEALLGGRIDRNLTSESIERLVDEQVAEFDQLDFKREMYKSDPAGRAELAKDVAAFANHTGGLLICGVADVRGTASKAMPWSASDSDIRHVHSVIAAHTSPLPQIDAFVVPADDACGYLLIAVAPSPWAPHAVSANDEALAFPVRHGSATRYLRQPELADRYRNRFDAASTQIEHLDRIMAEAASQMHSHAPWLYLALVPNIPGRGTITAASRVETTRWMHSDVLTGPLERRLYTETNSIGVGRMITAYRSQPGAPAKHLYAELHADGSGFAAYQLTDEEPDGDTGNKVWALGEDELADLAIALTALLTQHATRWTVPGDGVAELGVMAAKQPDSSPRLALFGHRHSRYVPLTDRRLADAPTSRHTIDIGMAAADINELPSTARILLTDLVQAFGIAEVHHIDAEGRIRPTAFSSSNAQLVDRWARDHGASTAL